MDLFYKVWLGKVCEKNKIFGGYGIKLVNDFRFFGKYYSLGVLRFSEI